MDPDLVQRTASTISKCFVVVHKAQYEVLAISDPVPEGYEALQGTLKMTVTSVSTILGYTLSLMSMVS